MNLQRDPYFVLICTFFVFANACTDPIQNSFRFLQQEEAFQSTQNINTKIDLLWVVDNSASMEVSQEKLRKGFQSFASRYMTPSWDIRVAVITTDTYMAHNAFQGYINRTIPGSVGWKAPSIQTRLATYRNSASHPNLVNLTTGALDSGLTYGHLIPAWGRDYAKLLPNTHDGPVAAFCIDLLPHFLKGATLCSRRDAAGASTGIESCLQPDSSNGETSVNQCINTTLNNTVRSGKTIISTQPPTGTPADTAWKNQLAKDFMINVTTGSAGQGSERGLGSFIQFLNDNESSATAFFRKSSLRGIIFVSDEDDQTLQIPDTPDADFSPQTHYKCDQSSLENLNGAAFTSGNNGLCCADPSKNCRYGSTGTSCPTKTVDGYSYTLSFCPDESKLLSVESIKESVDTFFQTLDPEQPDYFVAAIVPTSAKAIQDLQSIRTQSDSAVGTFKSVAVDRGDRYLELVDLVGDGSLSLNIAEDDYAPILEEIGKTILSKKSTFQLSRAPTSKDDMTVSIYYGSTKSTQEVPRSDYQISGKSIVITNESLVLALTSNDQITVNYQPSSAY